LPILSLIWGEEGSLYLGTDGEGVYRLAGDGDLASLTAGSGELSRAAVPHLGLAGDRLYAATPTTLFYADVTGDQPVVWTKSLPIPGWISDLVVMNERTVVVGTETSGVYRSTDAGASWQAASEGLGLAAGQMVDVTALRADPLEAGVLYVAVDHLLGSTQVHRSAAGTFATIDGGLSWQALQGPTFPEAETATELLVVEGRPLFVQAVTAYGPRSYVPDVEGALAALQGAEPEARARAATILGLARAEEAADPLLAALGDPEPAVSMAAAGALGRIAAPSAAADLLLALQHPREQVRLGAAQALGVMGVEAAVEPLRGMLLRGEGAEVVRSAEALGRIGSPAATDALLVALADADLTPRRHAAMAALEEMGPAAIEPLTRMLASADAQARHNAAEGLGWVGSPQGTAALLEALDDESAMVRSRAAWALGEIGDPVARAALERLRSEDPAAGVQVAATVALQRVRGEISAAAGGPVSWPELLRQLEAMRWLMLALSVAAAAWLALGGRGFAPVSTLNRLRNR
jgi:HEAT repeat protein